MRNWGFENLVAVLPAAAHLLAEPLNAATLLFQIGLNLVTYVNFHNKSVNNSLKIDPSTNAVKCP